eukprot:CAMPEP_0175740748 /NCGR_PEP_ID=MMETSP0097-20121207/55668_1 /TAXON_ID=311494 /ORGANISM="Alexandrium monilatum, Strain CCMP3105" /LENGTH=30 /DNA_ID= /DNA_START= /DNA_END= /DNA_ORIENTATION=
MLGSSPSVSMCPNVAKAVCHCPPFPQALMA